MKKPIRIMLLIMALTGVLNFRATAQTYNWNAIPIGGGGFVTNIKAHPKVPNLFFITKDVGTPYRWNAAEQKWEDMMLYGKIPTTYWTWAASAVAGEVSFDPNDLTGNVLYATIGSGKGIKPGGGTSMGTLMKSTDRGATWTDCVLPIIVRPNDNDHKFYMDRVVVDPNNSNVIYVTTTSSGTYKSTAAGAPGSWVKVTTPFPDTDNGRFIVFDKTGGVLNGVTKNIFLGSKTGVYLSTNGGSSFTLMSGSPANPKRVSFSNDGVLYVTRGAISPSTMPALHKWNGSSWNDVTPSIPANITSLGGIAVNPINSNEVIVTTASTWNHDIAYRSTAGGNAGSWTALVPTTRDATEAPHSLDGGSGNGNFGHNIATFIFDPFNAGHVWFSDMLDVGQSTNVWASAVHWKLRNKGLEEIVVSGQMVCPPKGSNFLLTATGDVGGFDHKSFTNPPAKGMANFFVTNNGVNTTGVAMQMTDPEFIARTGSDGWNGLPIGGYSTNGGLSYTKFPTMPTTASARGRIAVSATSRKIVWLTQGLVNGGLAYYSSNLGASWTTCSGLPAGILKPGDIYTIWAGMNPLAADKVDGNIFYVYAGGKVYVSTDGGASFAARASNLPAVGDVAQMNVETTPGKAGDIWIAFTSGLYHSTDTAKTFTQVNPTVVKNPKWVAVGRTDTTAASHPVIFVTSESGTVNNTTYGVFRSDDDGQTWTTIIDVLPTLVANLAADNQGRVYLGTAGDGIFVGEPAGGPVTSVAVTPAADSVIVGFTKQLKAFLTPTYPTNPAVSWSSSSSAIATVNASGLVTGVSPGVATITVTTQDGAKTAQSSIKVTPVVAVSSIQLDSTTLVGLGTSINLVATISPANATNKSVTWSSSDTTIAKVNPSGLVTTLNRGTTLITVTTVDGAKTASTALTVGDVIVANNCGGPTIANFKADTPSSASMWTSSTTTAVSTSGLVDPAPAAAYQTQRYSGTPLIYTFKSLVPGAIYKVRLHFAEISATLNGGQRKFHVTGNSVADTLLKNFDIYSQAGGRFKAIIREFELRSTAGGQITVVLRPIANFNYPGISAIEVGLIPLTSVAITPASFFVGVGDTTRLAITATPINATNQRVIWSSSQPSVASVDSKGLVKGISPGNATITAISEEGHFTSTSTVTTANIPVSGISLSSSTASMGVNNSITLTATVQPANATDKTYRWSSSDSTVVKVNQSGVLTALQPGTATITVTTNEGGKTASCVVTASNILISGITLNRPAFTLGVADTTSLRASVLPTNASNKAVIWSSSTPSIATVNTSGKVTAVSAGLATITATAQDEGAVSGSASVTVVSAGSCGLLYNNGFESSLINWLLPNGSKTKASEAAAHSGVKSAVISGDNSAINYGGALPIGAGREITFEVWAKIERTPDPYNQLLTPYWAGIGLDYYDAAGNKIANVSNQFQAFPYTGTAPAPGVFTRFTITRITPPNTASVGIWAAKAGPYGDFYLDDFCLTVAPESQTIAFDSLPVKTLGNADFTPVTSASSGLAVSLSSSDTQVATIVNGAIHLVGPGTTIITALQSGNANYTTAAPVSRTLAVVSGMQVLAMDGDAGLLTNNRIKPFLKIANGSSLTVPYQELTVRYWFTAENYGGISTWMDSAPMGTNKVFMQYVELPNPRTNALGYVEYRFDPAAGAMLPGDISGAIKSRMANTIAQPLSEGDDYSYTSSLAYLPNAHITLYRNGKLWWGTEPDSVATTTVLKVYSENKNTATTNSIRTLLKIENLGNVPIDYADVSVRYWFIADSPSSLNYFIDNAKVGVSNVSGVFGTANREDADTYFSLKVAASVGKLYPLSNTGNIQFRIMKSDKSVLNEANDYSYLPVAPLAENDHITAYYKGALIYGQEPAVASGARFEGQEPVGAVAGMLVRLLGNPVASDHARVLISGLDGSAVRIQVTDWLGNSLLEKTIDQPAATEMQLLPLGRQAGIYLITITSSKGTKSVKAMKIN